jgi:hypothetical protein
MVDFVYDEQPKIVKLLGCTRRLQFVLTDTYGVAIDQVTRVRIDCDNAAVDVHVGERRLPFKVKGDGHVMVRDDSVGGVAVRYDPWLAAETASIVSAHIRLGRDDRPLSYRRDALKPLPAAPRAPVPRTPSGGASSLPEVLFSLRPVIGVALLALSIGGAMARTSPAAEPERPRFAWHPTEEPVHSAPAAVRPPALVPVPAPMTTTKETVEMRATNEMKTTFAALAVTRDVEHLDRCFALMQQCYICDLEMAKRPRFFASYADAVMGLLRTTPTFAKTKLRHYIDYLVRDLPDTDVPELAKKGAELAALLAEIDSGKR